MNPSKTTERWLESKRIFGLAIDLPASQRTAFVSENCEDATLRAEILQLIRQSECEPDFLEPPLADLWAGIEGNATAEDPLVGSAVAGFCIEGRIGAGGMGTVYAARQMAPNRWVAIKLLNPLQSAAQRGLQRFEAESRALARLQHPGIAHVYASGAHDFGFGKQLWFAMELIDGTPLNHFMKERSLTVRQRLMLILKICDAVQHAHDRGIIHRDLKPANILIVDTSDDVNCPAQPKIVDFGVARIEESDRGQVTQTQAGEILGTLNYMSPEQLRGEANSIRTSSDQFSVAVIGFELLTGQLPHARPTSSWLAAIRSAEWDEARKLSDLDVNYRGDLEVIFSKALETDASRRYSSIRHFAEDLRRYLDRRPILARPASQLYRASRFVSRHRMLATSMCISFLAISGGLILFAIEARRANRAAAVASSQADKASLEAEKAKYESEKAIAVSSFITNDLLLKILVNKPAGPERRLVSPPELIALASANIRSMFGDRPTIEAAVRNEVGTIYYNLGAFLEARDEYQRVLELWGHELGDAHVDTLKAANNLGLCYMHLGETEKAEKLLDRALRGRTVALGESDSQTLATMNNLAILLQSTHRTKEAEQLLRVALDQQERVLGLHHKDTLTTAANLASLFAKRGEIEKAKQIHLAVYEACRTNLGEDHVTTLASASRAAQTLHLGGEHTEALVILTPVLHKFEKLKGPAGHDTITARRLLSRIYKAQGDREAAKLQLQLALEALGPDQTNSEVAAKIRRDDALLDTQATETIKP